MKTYEEFIDEVVTEEYKRINPVAMNIHKNAAKKYAKQFIDEALSHAFKADNFNTVVLDSVLYDVKDLIDKQ